MADKQGPNTISRIRQKILELWDDNTTVLQATVPMESAVSIKGSVCMTCSKHFLLWEIFKQLCFRHAEKHTQVFMKCSLLTSDLNPKWNVPTFPPPIHTHNDRTESLAHLCIRIMHYAVNLLFIYRYYNEVLIKDVNIFCPALYSAVSLLCWG